MADQNQNGGIDVSLDYAGGTPGNVNNLFLPDPPPAPAGQGQPAPDHAGQGQPAPDHAGQGQQSSQDDLKQKVDEIESLIKLNPQVTSNKELMDAYKALKEKLSTGSAGASGANSDGKGNSQTPNSDASSSTQSDFSSPLLKGFVVRNQGAPQAMTPEEFFSSVKEKHSIDPTNPEGLATLFDTIGKWRTDSADKGQIKQQLDSLVSYIDSLPAELGNVLKAHSENRDWKKELSNSISAPSFDAEFDTLSEDQKRSVLNYYFKGEFDSSDLEDLSDPSLKTTIKSAKLLYNNELASRQAQAAAEIQKRNDRIASFRQSVSKSVESLKQDFPGFGDSQISQIENLLAQNAIGQLFFDKNGSLLPDAAKKVAFVLFGDETLEEAKRLASQSASVAVSKQFAFAQNSSAPATGGGNSQASAVVDNQVLEQLNSLLQTSRAMQNPYDVRKKD